jgi:hypothetical protein
MEIPTENGNRLVRRSPTVVPISLPEAQNDAKPTTEIEALTESSNKLLKVIKDLTHHGIDAELGVPKIVVIGDQSSGKSSLIEALTRIPVPRGKKNPYRTKPKSAPLQALFYVYYLRRHFVSFQCRLILYCLSDYHFSLYHNQPLFISRTRMNLY